MKYTIVWLLTLLVHWSAPSGGADLILFLNEGNSAKLNAASRCNSARYLSYASLSGRVIDDVAIPPGAANVSSRAEARETAADSDPKADTKWVACDKTPDGKRVGYVIGAMCAIGQAGFIEELSRRVDDGSLVWRIKAINDTKLGREFRYIVEYDCGPEFPDATGNAKRSPGICSSAAIARLHQTIGKGPVDGRLEVAIPPGATVLKTVANAREVGPYSPQTRQWVPCDKDPSGKQVGYIEGAICTIGAAGFSHESSRTHRDGSTTWSIKIINNSGHLSREYRYIVYYNCGPVFPSHI